MMSVTTELGGGIWQIALVGTDDLSYTTGYLILEDKKVLLETGASSSNPVIHQAFSEVGLKAADLDAIIVTHAHLDHSGGAGLLMKQCPQAILLAHPKAAPHLSNSSKLEAAARNLYGEAFDSLFAPIEDVDPTRLQSMQDGESFELSPQRKLTFHFAEGHALHHFVVFDSQTGSLFTGDAAGMSYPILKEHYNVDLVLPATTPSQYDPKALEAFLARLLELRPQQICFTHYGTHPNPEWVVKELKGWLPLFAKKAIKQYKQHPRLEALKKFLLDAILDELQLRGVPRDNEALNKLIIDTDLNAQGIIAYVKRLEKAKHHRSKRLTN